MVFVHCHEDLNNPSVEKDYQDCAQKVGEKVPSSSYPGRKGRRKELLPTRNPAKIAKHSFSVRSLSQTSAVRGPKVVHIKH